MSITSGLAALALLPAIIGPLTVEEGGRSLVLALCGGGEVSISLDDEDGVTPPLATTPCCAKGCRSKDKRKLLDPRQ